MVYEQSARYTSDLTEIYNRHHLFSTLHISEKTGIVLAPRNIIRYSRLCKPVILLNFGYRKLLTAICPCSMDRTVVATKFRVGSIQSIRMSLQRCTEYRVNFTCLYLQAATTCGYASAPARNVLRAPLPNPAVFLRSQPTAAATTRRRVDPADFSYTRALIGPLTD